MKMEKNQINLNNNPIFYLVFSILDKKNDQLFLSFYCFDWFAVLFEGKF